MEGASLRPATLLRSIAARQSPGDRHFPAGLFPAYRRNPRWRIVGRSYERPDANLFCTAAVVWVLQQCRPLLTEAEQNVVDGIVQKATATYRLFQSKDGGATFNFYATRPTQHFPNGWLMHRLRHFQLPDDVDDSALAWLTLPDVAKDSVALKAKLAEHVNGQKRYVANTWPAYRRWPIYSTWFGTAGMPVEFDVCALANLMCWVLDTGLPLNEYDDATLRFLADVVQTGRWRTEPFRAAHNYARPSLIAYHLTRLIHRHDPPALRSARATLLCDMPDELAIATSSVDKLLFATSLARSGRSAGADASLGATLPGPEHSELPTPDDAERFPVFIAGMLSAYEQPWLYRWASRPFWHIEWHCPALVEAWALEYTLLRSENG